MDCKTTVSQNEHVIPFQNSKRDLNSLLHHPTNAGVKATAKPKAPSSRTHFNQGAHLRTTQLRACCAHFCSSAVAATCDALRVTTLVARKLRGASFSLVRKCAGKPLLHFPESSFDHPSIWWFSSNRVTWPDKWANEHSKRHVKSPKLLPWRLAPLHSAVICTT